MTTYQHRQFSPWPLAALGLVSALSAAYTAKGCKRRASSLPSLGFALFVLQFCVLSTRVDESGLSWNFGLGFPSGFIAFDEIAGVELAKTKLWEGYGIHWTPRHGWLWNAAGRDAVRIRKRHGAVITIGCDDAAGLYDAICSRLP